jgi:serine/threonine protein kinase
MGVQKRRLIIRQAWFLREIHVAPRGRIERSRGHFMAAANGERPAAALLIGIGSYLHDQQVWPLKYAARDAEAMAGALIDPEVCGFPPQRVKLLADRSATRDILAHHLSKWLPEQARGAEIALIYFAGHGMIHRIGQRDEGYLLPHDADPDDLVTHGVLMADLARWIEAIDAGAVVVCLDCCHAAKVIPRGGTGEGPVGRDMRIRPALFQELSGRGRYLIASCDDGQVSVEADTWGHGLFTYHLLEGLRGAGDRDGDGRIGIAELFEYVAIAVDRDARAMGMAQKPWSFSIGPGGVYLSAPKAQQVERECQSTRSAAARAIERIWREQGPAPAIREIERTTDPADVSQVTSVLGLLKAMASLEGIPFLFRCLAHASEEVRTSASKAIQTFRWGEVAAAVEDLARRGDAERIGFVLDGLAAYEAHRDVVALLDRLVSVLKGDTRNRTILLMERKQQSLELDRVAELFRESGSPYQIAKPLGQGLFTAAYLARDESNELDVVVRVLRPEFSQWPQIRAQFLDLGRRSLKLVHHNLVHTREVKAFPERQIYYLVRDHVDGVTLQKLLEAGRVFAPGQILKILRQLLHALTPIHATVVAHGSIKPSNIFLCGEDQVILGDLALPMTGISVQLDRLSYDYRYAPPEMFRQGGALGPWSDFYSLGCVAYELCCGAPPFVSDSHFELAAKHDREAVEHPSRRGSCLGPAGDSVLLRFLAKSPSDRFADVDAACRAIDELEHAIRPKTRPDLPSRPVLADESLIRYSTDAMMSVVLFTTPLPSEPDASEFGTRSTKGGLSEGSLLPAEFGRYKVIGRIGAGGMGAVYRARDEQVGREVAIKVLRNVPGATLAMQSFLREASFLGKLNHPGFAALYDVGEERGTAYMVVEYVAGRSLAHLLRDAPLPPRSAAELTVTLARAMHHAHETGIVHRDLKPSNIIITPNGAPKILDLGLAFLLGNLDQTDATTWDGTIVGTPMYMSPEQARGDMNLVGPATDVYSLGAVLYEMLARRTPFEGRSRVLEVIKQVTEAKPEPPSRWRRGVPRALDAICLKCLEKNPAKRYTTAAALADDLERYLAGKLVLASPSRIWDWVVHHLIRSLPTVPKRSGE